jgi:hypothetical protein
MPADRRIVLGVPREVTKTSLMASRASFEPAIKAAHTRLDAIGCAW